MLTVLSSKLYVYMFTSLQASLERIGVDSKGTVYWYDGGKNMFQSPPSNDPAYKPRYKKRCSVAHLQDIECPHSFQFFLEEGGGSHCISEKFYGLLQTCLSVISLLYPCSESELQLSCKSMVQWTAKLK